MNKNEVKTFLKNGKTLDELFKFCDGQECMIFKADEFAASDDVIYIPDLDLNGIVTDRPMTPNEIEEAVAQMYTGNDFIDECNDNIKLAKYVFEYVDWQHPSAVFGDIRQFSDEEMIEICGKTYDQLFGGNKLVTDIEQYISPQLNIEIKNTMYSVIILSQLSGWETIIKNLALNINGYIYHPHNGKVDLYQLFPYSFLDFGGNYLFVIDSIKNIEENHNWIINRKNLHDIVIDAHGNVMALQELVS